jgi:hypothetical protein
MFASPHRNGRRGLLTFSIAILSVAGFALAADTAVDAIFGRVRAVLAADVANVRGVACMESVQRTRYAPRKPGGNAGCGELITAAPGLPRGAVEWRSRLRLSVKAGTDAEEFGLTDAGTFERTDIAGMLSAATAGNGEFSTFLRNLMAGDDPFQSRGLQQTPLGQLFVVGFTVPAEKSHFRFASFDGRSSGGGSTSSPAAYRGSLYAMPDSGELKRLTLEAENTGGACRVQYVTEYASTRVGDREIILPKSSTMEAVYSNGSELRTETYYSGCHRPVATAGAPDRGTVKPLPPGVRLRIRFESSIDSETAATGDPVTGVVRTTVKDKQNGIIVHAGDRLHGRIAAIEETLSPQPRWNLSIVFETIELGVGDHGIDQGVEQPVSVVWVDTASRGRGGESFVFNTPSFALDQKFETDWETR